ncbi:hypothetical protein Tco_1537770, partial [Tanacetum coccineum]
MATVNDVPQLVDKKGGSYAAIAPKLELGKSNKWKKRMLCYLAGMEPYYLKCIKDGPFQPKTTEDDIMESVIICETAKETWTDLVHSFEGPSDTKENRIMDLKLEYLMDLEMPIILRLLTKQISMEGLSMRITNLKKDFQENSDDEVDERSSKEYLRDLDIEFHERALLANSKLTSYSSMSKGFQPKFTPKLSSQNSISQADTKVQKDYKA